MTAPEKARKDRLRPVPRAGLKQIRNGEARYCPSCQTLRRQTDMRVTKGGVPICIGCRDNSPRVIG
ncbi:hypothetical protein SEA_AELIN_87 [Mycobacterium phage Aelin]|uniref:Uncharacterized protein n=7 Tax=Pegunavirus TaxID=1623295 RepID=A0A899IPK1_9CAUD|nr:hypothetical protein VISTA_87 [Mycobacterium phage Vista]YP_009190042.1 hypothetical protein AU153_gp85 [Mycobacterium phage Pops]AER49297.1 hypothetical protein TALLGRASSMM_87 [Mycobacterium phage TallGrassMM]AHY84355.1 hypothetical protein PBI_KINGVEVEVE_86 [Mycobacterium phage KingVeVeVe]ATN88796.1 hypothetical protein SEA_DINGO_85 [Mycobacterium phage Dingo]ATN90590.1 hypothetical protein SEA_LONGACAUDA_89 [Mycobacterium phage Longacauda]AZF96945.1 hypothetical protein SEA_JILLIUM_89 [